MSQKKPEAATDNRHDRGVDCPYVAVFTSDTNDPEPVEKADTTKGDSSTTDEPPEPVDIDRESR